MDALLLLAAAASAYTCPVTLKFVIFHDISSSNSGGAISLSTSNCNLSLINCLFSRVYSAQYGGAIYMMNGSNFTSVSSCYYACGCVYQGFSVYVSATSTAFSLTDFCQCYSNDTSNGYGNLRPCSTNLTVCNTNYSLQSAGNFGSMIYSMTSGVHLETFCDICNNTDVANGATIDYQGSANPMTSTSCNIIGNNPKESYGFIWLDYNANCVVFQNCLFIGNANCTFVKLGGSNMSSYPTFSNCLFDISASMVSYCTVKSCSFGVTSATQIAFSLLKHSRCLVTPGTDLFTVNHAAKQLILNSLSFLFLMPSIEVN